MKNAFLKQYDFYSFQLLYFLEIYDSNPSNQQISWHCLQLQLGSLTTGLVGGYALKTMLKCVPVTISKRISKN